MSLPCLWKPWLPLVVVVVWCVGYVVPQTCPSTCQCLLPKVVCKGGNLGDTLAKIPQYSYSVEISSVNLEHQLEQQHFNACQAKNNIKDFTLIKSQIGRVSKNAFDGLFNLGRLNLSHNTLTEIAGSAFFQLQSLTQLDLSTNRLSSVEPSISSLSSLTYLNLAQNNIQTIRSGLFQALTRLQTLILDGNRLTSLQGHTFQGLGNLLHLSLRSCGINALPHDLFYIIRKLQTLDLRSNYISVIPSSQNLRNLAYLQELRLDENRVTELHNIQFGSISIDTLSLSQNRIHTVSQYAFKYFNAKLVDLSFNQIFELHPGIFQPLAPEITHLNLAGNLLTQINTGVFQGLYRLEQLNLSRCSIASLSGDDFASLHRLRVLDLSQNKLANLSWAVTNKMSLLVAVNLEANPWHCDCGIQPLRDWLQESGNRQKLTCSVKTSQLQFSNNCERIQCHSPNNIASSLVHDLDNDQVSICSTSVSPQGLSLDNIVIIVSVIVIMVCISATIFIILWKKQCFKKIFKHKVKSSKQPPYYPYNSDQASLDLGSINDSDRGFPLRTYMQALEAMNGQFYDITPTDSQARASEQYNTGSDFAVETQSRTCSSLPSTVVIGRESAV